MLSPNPRPQPSASDDGTEAVDRDSVLVMTSFVHPPGRCGQRVESPHERCQAKLTPYLAAERFVLRRAVIVLCRCGEAWREIAA